MTSPTYPLTKTNVRVKTNLIDDIKQQTDNHNFLVRTALDNFARALQLDRVDYKTRSYISGNMTLRDYDGGSSDKTTQVTFRLTASTLDYLKFNGYKLSRCVHCAIKNLLQDL